ncbi:SatD family protein [Clostridium sp. WLY-B-L2]|uniref:SatD family protein n=1 Tax=Clostridium aromativorans TaxID=2836848 RepID=A0ABS8N826_9CLOT|nr:SatD family protein [Clostridium aromativorans]MCC9295952.1 SatD family protein [Clostridium aromativorans]
MKKYSALIIDLKKSRSYEHFDRINLQNYIKNTILILNKIFANVLELNVVFSAGDEVQGLFSSPQAAYLYLRLFNMLIFPVEIRAGIGVGEWSVRIDSGISTEQDGSAYHNARYAINNVEDSLGYSILLFSKSQNDIYINSAISTAAILVKNQSQYQNELFLLSELMYPIDINGALKFNNFEELNSLIAQKNQIGYYVRWKSSRNIQKYPLSVPMDFSFGCNPINALADEEQFYVSSGKVKGLPAKLAKLLGTSRQNMDKSIRAGNIYQARNSAIVALKLMNQYISEERQW